MISAPYFLPGMSSHEKSEFRFLWTSSPSEIGFTDISSPVSGIH
jgi:hypothetical protein